MSSLPGVLPEPSTRADLSLRPPACTVTETLPESVPSRPSVVHGLGGGAQEPLLVPPPFHFGYTPASVTTSSHAQNQPGSSKAPAATPAATSAALATGDGSDTLQRPRANESRVLDFDAAEAQRQPGSGGDRAAPPATQVAGTLAATQAFPSLVEATQVQIIPETQEIIEDIEDEGAEEAHDADAQAPAADASEPAPTQQTQRPADETEDIDICGSQGAATRPIADQQALPVAAAAATAAGPLPSAPLSEWDVQRLVDYWLGTATATGTSIPQSQGAPTAATLTLPVASLHSAAAEFEALLKEWNDDVMRVDDDKMPIDERSFLRMNILTNLSHEVARAFFGDCAVGRLDAREALAEFSRAIGLALWQLETRDVGVDSGLVKERCPGLPAHLMPPAAPAVGPAPRLMEHLTFAAAEDAGAAVEELGPLSEADEAQIQGLLCLKEEAAEREASALAAEAAGADWRVCMRPNRPNGTPFTNAELAAKLTERRNAAVAAGDPGAAADPSGDNGPAAADNPDALQIEPTLTPSPENASLSGPAEGVDGPHELQVDLTGVPADAAKSCQGRPSPLLIGSDPVLPVPPVTETDTTADLPLALGIARPGAGGSSGGGAAVPARRAVLEESSSQPNAPLGVSWMGGGWAPPRGAPAAAASPSHLTPGAPSDQATPSEVWRHRAGGVGAGGPITAVPETQQERLTGRKEGGSGAVQPPAPPPQPPAAQLLSVIPATEDEDELEERVDPASTAPVGCSAAPPTAEDVAGEAAGAVPQPPQRSMPDDMELASQPVGSQEVRAALHITALLVDDLSAGAGASQQPESDRPLGTPSAARILAGGLMKAPPPRKSSRLAPAAAQPEPAAAEAVPAAEEVAPAGPPEPPCPRP